MKGRLYRYVWGNEKTIEGFLRLKYKDRLCRVLSWMPKNSCIVQFIDNGEKSIVSRNALRKVKKRRRNVEVHK